MNVSKIVVGILAAALAGSSFALGEDRDLSAKPLMMKNHEEQHGLTKKQKHKVKKAVKNAAKKEVKAAVAENHPEAAAFKKAREGRPGMGAGVVGGDSIRR